MGWQDLDAFLRRHGIRIGAPTTGQTSGGSHTTGSFHYQGLARDYSWRDSDVAGITRALLPYAQGPDAPISELFDSRSNVFYDNGRPITASSDLRLGHYSHVHVALRPGVQLGDLAVSPSTGTGRQTATDGGSRLLGEGLAGSIARTVVEAVLVAGGVVLAGLGIYRGFAKQGAPA